MSDYGDKFETPIIVIMCFVMLLATLLVVGMNVVFKPDCIHSDYTYCRPVVTDHH